MGNHSDVLIWVGLGVCLCIFNFLSTRWWNRVPILATEFFIKGYTFSHNAHAGLCT